MEREMVPAFQEERYFRGLDMATTVMINLTSGKFSADGYMGEGGFVMAIPFIILMILFFVSFSM
jgi:uncharacterized protein